MAWNKLDQQFQLEIAMKLIVCIGLNSDSIVGLLGESSYFECKQEGLRDRRVGGQMTGERIVVGGQIERGNCRLHFERIEKHFSKSGWKSVETLACLAAKQFKLSNLLSNCLNTFEYFSMKSVQSEVC